MTAYQRLERKQQEHPSLVHLEAYIEKYFISCPKAVQINKSLQHSPKSFFQTLDPILFKQITLTPFTRLKMVLKNNEHISLKEKTFLISLNIHGEHFSFFIEFFHNE